VGRARREIAVMAASEATEYDAALEARVERNAAVYWGGQRGIVNRSFEPGNGVAGRCVFEVGQVRLVLDGRAAGLIGTGLGTQWSIEAADRLAARGIEVSLLHVPTLKPVDQRAIADYCTRFPVVTTVENHSTIGGLASVVAESIAAAGIPTRLRALGVPDRWAQAGSLDYIRRSLGLDAESIAHTVEEH